MFTSIHTLKDLHILIIVQGVPVQALLMSFSLFKRSAIKKIASPWDQSCTNKFTFKNSFYRKFVHIPCFDKSVEGKV